MNRILAVTVFVSLIILSQSSYAQSCCTKSSDFQLLALNTDFKEAHLSPEPLNYTPTAGAMIEFNTMDAGKPGKAFYVPSDAPTNNVLIIFHEWWGLNDYIKREAERWQSKLGNIDVYAVDLYDGQVAADPETAGKLANGLDKKRGENIIKGLISKIGPNRSVATLGWCMGGSWSFTTTLLLEQKATGCVMFYGFPENNVKKIKALRTDVLYIWGSQDKFITKEVVDEFGKQVIGTRNKFDLHSYDAVHAFANPSNPKHDKEATAQAELLTVEFLKRKLGLE